MHVPCLETTVLNSQPKYWSSLLITKSDHSLLVDREGWHADAKPQHPHEPSENSS